MNALLEFPGVIKREWDNISLALGLHLWMGKNAWKALEMRSCQLDHGEPGDRKD